MNYYGSRELANSFRTVRKNTILVAQDIPEEKYSFRPAPDTRSVGELLSHIALAKSFQEQVHAKERRKNMDGFDFPALMQSLRPFRSDEATHEGADTRTAAHQRRVMGDVARRS